MTKCVVCGKLEIRGGNHVFHRFPIDNQKRNIWLCVINKANVAKTAKICSDHFDPKDYIIKRNGQKGLKDNAIPTFVRPSVFSSQSSDSDISMASDVFTNSTQDEAVPVSLKENNDTARESNTVGVKISKFSEYQATTPIFEYTEDNKEAAKDGIVNMKAESCVDVDTLYQTMDSGIKIEISTSNEIYNVPLKRIKDEPGLEDMKPCELTLDTIKHIKTEENMLAVLVKTEEEESGTHIDSLNLQLLTEELVMKPDFRISDDENCSAELDRAVKENDNGVMNKKRDRGSFVCYHCNIIVHSKKDLIYHITVENCSLKGRAKKTIVSKKLHHSNEYFCIKCNKIFKVLSAVNNHVVQNHEEFIGSASSNLNQCEHCNYNTTFSQNTSGQMTSKSSVKQHSCNHCKKTFNSQKVLDDHVIRNHEEFVGSVSSKIHQCIHCSYKTTQSSHFTRHMTKHPESGCSVKQFPCIYCDKIFKSQQVLDDHVVKNHEEYIEYVATKIHKCKHCSYKTTISYNIVRHMRKHPESGRNLKLRACIHCDKTFQSKQALDDHVIKNHEESIESVSSKIHQCSHCTYKTMYLHHLVKHMERHPESGCSAEQYECIHCDKIFKSKLGRDGHVIRKHIEFISSISSKIYQCKHCIYKTTDSPQLARHMRNHPESGCSQSRS